MQYISTSRLTIAFLIFFILCCLTDLVLFIIDSNHAERVSVRLTAKQPSNLTNVLVYRVSPNGNQRVMTERSFLNTRTLAVDGELLNMFYRGLRIELTPAQQAALTNADILIGTHTFRFNQQTFLRQWPVVQSTDSTRTYESPDWVASPRSHLPVLNKIINWKGDLALGTGILASNFPILLLPFLLLSLRTPSGSRLTEQFKRWLLRPGNVRNLTVGLTILLTLYRMPFTIIELTSGLDPSWMIGLNWAYVKDLRWGHDLAFTYGPLYWLFYPSLQLPQSTLLIALILTLLLFGLSMGVIVYLALQNVVQDRLSVQTVLAIILLLVLIEYGLTDVVTIACVLLLVLSSNRQRIDLLLLAVVMLALVSLAKFSFLALALAMLTLYSGFCVINRQFRTIGIAWFSFIAINIAVWLLSGQQLNDYPVFLARSFQVAQGYSEAMATPSWNETSSSGANLINLVFFGIAILTLVGVFLFFIATIQTHLLWMTVLLSSPIVFLAFKEGYIRFDYGHFVLFFSQWLLVLIAYLLVLNQRPLRSSWFPVHLFLGLSILCCLVVLQPHEPTYNQRLKGIFSQTSQEQQVEHDQQVIRAGHPIGRSVYAALSSEQPVDIIPYDISLLYAYHANWKPRPVMQSYTAFTAALDSMNARTLSTASAPPLLLYSFKSIDNRYPLFDEPFVTQQLIRHYKVMSNEANAYLLLGRKNEIKPVHTASIQRQELCLNQTVPVPVRKGHYTYLSANIKLTTLGRLLNFLYKIPPLYLEMQVEGNKAPIQVRLTRQTATDGLLVSTYATTMQDVIRVLSGTSSANVKAIRVKGNAWLYQQQIATRFIAAAEQ